MKKFLLVFGLLSQLSFAQDNVQDTWEPSNDSNYEEALAGDENAETPILDDQELSFRKVGIPANYVYNPSRGGRHDYCTSPAKQSWGDANFRGPCARHDMCYDSSTDKKVCDARLWKDMRENCDAEYAFINPKRHACHKIADIYLAAVVIHH